MYSTVTLFNLWGGGGLIGWRRSMTMPVYCGRPVHWHCRQVRWRLVLWLWRWLPIFVVVGVGFPSAVVLDGGVGAGLFVVAFPLALARLDGSGSGNLREPFIVGGRSFDLPVFCWRRCWSFGYVLLAFRVVVSVSRRRRLFG